MSSGELNSGGYDLTGIAGGTFAVSNGAKLTLTGTTGLPPGFGTYSIGATSTVDYAGGTQTITDPSIA